MSEPFYKTSPLSNYRDSSSRDDTEDSTTINVIVVMLLIAAIVVILWVFVRRAAVAQPDELNAPPPAQVDDVLSLPRAVVMIHADWCGHCKATMPQWEQAAAASSVPFALVDGDKSTELIEKWGVRGFPTILLIERGVVVQRYEGDRSASSIAEFASGKQE
jgi:thiol-disulfide isomerase/thioredoxin